MFAVMFCVLLNLLISSTNADILVNKTCEFKATGYFRCLSQGKWQFNPDSGTCQTGICAAPNRLNLYDSYEHCMKVCGGADEAGHNQTTSLVVTEPSIVNTTCEYKSPISLPCIRGGSLWKWQFVPEKGDCVTGICDQPPRLNVYDSYDSCINKCGQKLSGSDSSSTLPKRNDQVLVNETCEFKATGYFRCLSQGKWQFNPDSGTCETGICAAPNRLNLYDSYEHCMEVCGGAEDGEQNETTSLVVTEPNIVNTTCEYRSDRHLMCLSPGKWQYDPEENKCVTGFCAQPIRLNVYDSYEKCMETCSDDSSLTTEQPQED